MDDDKNKLVVVHAISRTLSSLLDGVANSSMKCMTYPGCIQSGGVGGITDAGTLGYNAFYYIEKTIVVIVKIIGVFSDTIAPVLEEAIFGDLANKPWSEVAPIITRIINEKKDYLNEMSQNPEIQEALKEWAEAYATISIQTMEAVRPSLNLMIDEALETLSESGSKAATGVVNLGLNVASAAVAEVPVAGGIIDMVMAIIRGVNQALIAAAPIIQFGTESIGTGLQTSNRMLDVIQTGKQRVEAASQTLQALKDKFTNMGAIGTNARETFQNMGKQFGQNVIQGAVQTPMLQTPLLQTPLLQTPMYPPTQFAPAQMPMTSTTVGGGGARKQLKKKINKTTQRIKNTLSKFNSFNYRKRKTRRRLK